MKQSIFLRHGIRLAGVATLASVLLFTVITVLSYRSDKKLIDLWEGYQEAEEQLFRLREDANRLFEIEHRLSVGGVHLDVELKAAGAELSKVPSLENFTRRKLSILKEAREHLLQGRDGQSRTVLLSQELDQINKDLREAIFEFEINERSRLQEKMEARIENQQRILEFDMAGIMLAIVLILSASVVVLFYIQRLRRYDRDLISARNEAERASRMKSAFLANMSHEIRTPLNGVLGLTRLLRESKLDSEQQEIVSALDASGRTLYAIVNDILDLSKIESGKLEIEKEVFELRELLQNVERLFRPVAVKKSLHFVNDNLPEAFFALGDAPKVSQVLQNLISNAVKFTKQGEVRMSCRRYEEDGRIWFRFEVKDSGIGIPEEAFPRLFHPFEQADSSTSRHFGGSGLGLAICRHLVEAMGGKIGVESRVHVGSMFWFTLPVDPAPAPQSHLVRMKNGPAGAEAVPSAVVQWGRILLVEDNEINRHLVITFLQRRGFDVQAAETGHEALSMFKTAPHDFILMDVHLPEMDGYETTRRLRAGEAGPKGITVPIAALTASAIKGEKDKCLAAGMNDYLTKPVDLDALESLLRKTLRRDDKNERVRKVPDLDEDLRRELWEILRKVTPDRMKTLRQALETSDYKTVGKVAHTMKSSVAQLGLMDLAEVFRRMEAKGFADDGDGWSEMRREMDQELEKAGLNG